MKIRFDYDIPAARIADLIITAVEGGSTYWCSDFLLVRPHQTALRSPWYSDPSLYTRRNFRINVIESEDGKAHMVGPAELRNGLRIMATKYASHFGDFLNENEDATTADVFLQCVALGEIVYG